MVEIYRDARDFQNILGAYGLGKGYGYDALASGWGSSTGHGSSYAAAMQLTAADPTATRQGTRFDDVYTNSIGEAPVGHIGGFSADNYYVWLLVGGGSNAERGAHGVQIGANPEEIVNSPADSRIFVWQQVGANAYAIDAATPVDIQWKNIDGYLHAVRAICLKSDVGAPGQMPAGNGGDLIVGMAAVPPADSTTVPPADSGEATASADSTTTATTESTASADSATPAADTTTGAESTPPVDLGQSTPDTSTAPTDSSGSGAADSGSGSTDSTSTAPADSTAPPSADTTTAPTAGTGSTPDVLLPPPSVEAPPPAAPKPPKRPPRPSMSESELVNRMAAAPVGAELTKAGIKALTNSLFEEIVKALVSGEEFTFIGFGRFYVAQTQERIGRNPYTGGTITIPARKVPRFKPGKMLKDSLAPKSLPRTGSGV